MRKNPAVSCLFLLVDSYSYSPNVYSSLGLYNTQNPNFVNKIASEGAVPYGRYFKNTSGNATQRTISSPGVERENAVQKGFRFWCFLVHWETFLDRILAFSVWRQSRKMFFESRYQ